MARGFLVIVPFAFVAGLVTYLLVHGRAAEAFTPYPFLTDALGQGFGKRPLPRFAVIASVLFLLPYVVTSLLLFLADAGVEVASRQDHGPGHQAVAQRHGGLRPGLYRGGFLHEL